MNKQFREMESVVSVKVTEADNRVGKARENMECFRKHAQALQAAKDKLLAESKVHAIELETFRSRAESSTEQLQSEKDQLAALLKDADAKFALLSTEHSNITSTLQRVLGERDSLPLFSASMESRLKDLSRENGALEDKVRAHEMSAKNASSECARLADELSSAKESANKMRQMLLMSKTRTTSLEEQVDEQRKHCTRRA